MKKLLMFFIAVAFSGISWGQIVVSGSVGADGTYASLTKNGGAFAAINAQTQTGAVITISITGDVLNEDGANSLNAGVWTSITITPSGDRIISGASSAGNPLINLNGADNVTINGLNDGSNSLTISNTLVSSTSGTSTIRFIADATNNTITNCTILGAANMALATNGGTIFFSTATTTGNDNNTISNCKIGPVGSNLPSKGIHANGTTTSATTNNSGITINNCEIYDFFLTGGSAGIYISTGNTEWNITNNKFYQTATRTYTASGTMYGIYYSNTTHGNNIQITGNTIGYSAANGTGTFTTTGSSIASNFAGIYLAASSTAANTCNINNNTISDFSFTSSTGYFYGIQNATSASSNTININNNTIKNISLLTTTGAFYGISWGSATNISISGNNVYGISRTGGGTTYGIYSGSSSVNETVSNNNVYNISSNTTSAASTIRGISQGTATGIKNFQNNNIYNLTGNNGSSIIGIYIGYATTGNISVNNIYGLNSTGGSSGTVYGIQNGGTSVTTMNIYRNNIYNLSMTSTGGTLYGILATSGTTNNIYNNFISDLKLTAVNSAIPLSGIHIAGGTNANVYYNTVYLNASSTGALFGSQAIYASTTPTLDMRNNIFVNVSTPNGSGYAVAYRRSSTTLTTYSSFSNNNCFYALSSTNQGIFYDGTNFKQSMADYKTWVSARDAASFSEDVDFMEKTNPPYDLRIKGGSPTQCESGGQRITTPAITNDYYGTIRALETGYLGTGTAPDIGAFEGELTPLDLIAPVINYTPLANTSSTTDRTLTATITDASGVDAAILYWKVNSDPYQAVQGVNTSGNNWEFTFGGNVNPGDVISYYIVAQDINKNVGAVPNAGVTSYTSDPPACSPDPTNPSTYTIVGAISGDKTIGVGKDYETLTAAFADIANKEVTGSINLLLTDTYAGETAYPLVINPVAGLNSSTTITIKPDAGQTINITGNSTTAIFRFAGADYIIIDGSNNGTNSKDLTITNSAASGAVILFSSLGNNAGATNNTVKNCNIIGGGTSGGYGISIGGATAGTAGADNDNITITNNNIGKTNVGIYAFASTTANATDNLIISNNVIGNDVDANSVGNIGINMSYCNNSNILNNVIKNLKDGTTPKGIFLSTGVTNTAVDRNNINKIWYTGTSGYGGWGININTGNTASNITVKNNIIYDIMGDGWNSITGSSMSGIVLDGTTGGINIYHNTVNLSGNYSRSATATITTSLFVNSSVTNLDIRNNIFTNSMVNTANTGAKAYAIYSSAANTAFTNINYNDYFVSGVQGVLGYIGSDRTDLAGIQAGFGQNLNSINNDPVYVSATDLTPTVAPLNSTGQYIASVGYDYFNVSRSNPPDIGAIEFNPPSYDAGLIAMSTPPVNVCSSTYPVTFTVKNYATSDIDLTTQPITVNCSVTGPNPQTFGTQVLNTGTLLAGATQDVTFTTNYDMSAGGTYQFTATLTMNNDGNSANNTLITSRTVTAPLPLDYVQNFNASTSLPSGWSGTMTVMTNHGTSSSNGLTYNLWSSATSFNSTSPKIGNVGANSVLTFDYRIVNYSSYPTVATTLGTGDKVDVLISTDCGTSFSTLYTINNTTHTPSTSFVNKSFDLSAYSGSPVIIKFAGTWATGDYYVDIDNFSVINKVLPTVTTTTASAITGNSATSGGNVTSDGNSTVTARGVCWSTSPNPTINDDKTTDGTGTGSFTSYLTNLNPSTKYYYRAYATNSIGTNYGTEYDFTTLNTYPPSLTTGAYSNLTNTDVTLNGEITSDGGDPTISESGFVYSTTSNPMIGDPGVVKVMTNPLVDNGTFDIAITGLTPGQTYYYKAYAINGTGTGYGSQSSFTTHNVPTVTTSNVTAGTTTANGGGNVTSDGGASVTARGVCWSTSANPTLSNSFTTDGNGTGSFSSLMTNLIPNGTTYYVRAYATNAYGTSYGNQVTFVTSCELYNLPFAENFNSSTLPGCWSTQNTGTGITERWSVSNTSLAGGSAYEMKCSFQNVNPGTTRLITPALNTAGLSSIRLTFKYMFDDYGAGATLKIQSSTDKVNWTDESWYLASSSNTNIGPATVTLLINNNLGTQTYLAFVVNGNLYQFDYWYIDNVSVTVPQANLWTGFANNAWENPANWDNGVVPQSNAQVTIPATAPNYPTVNAPTTINKLTIESNSTGTGSLLDNGNLTVTGNSTIKRYISGNKWHLLTSPITNALSGVFHLQAGQANIYIREYDPNTNSWSFITSLTAPLAVGKGYGIWADTQTNSTPDPVVSFNGPFNTGNITVPMVPNAWNIIGNPYPSAINWTLVDKATSLQNFGAAYFWKQSLSAGAGGYATHDGTVATNGATNVIPPMQGFFVKANTASLSFDNSMRVHTNQQLYNKSAGSINDMIRITASNGADYTDETVILFNSNATNGFDSQFDALKLFSNNANAPEVYTVADNNKLVINRFGSYPAAIPMNIRLGVNANITLTATEFDNYDANISIKLEDMLTGNIQDLRQNPSYTFAANIGENDNRFVLHFAQITGINEINATNVSIYAFDNTVYVNTNEKVKDISIYNMLGQLITSVEGNGKSIQTINLKNATAYYLVKVTTDKGVRTEKVFIK